MASQPRRRTSTETPEERNFRHRVYYLPIRLENARRKLAALENEARRFGLTDLLETKQ